MRHRGNMLHKNFLKGRQDKINFVSTLLLAGSIVAVFYYYWQGVYNGLGYPNNTCLFSPVDRFNDFVHTYNLTDGLNPYFKKYLFNSNYYPFLHILFYPFTLISLSYSFFVFTFLFLSFFIGLNSYYLRCENVLTINNIIIYCFCSYPVLFILDRGSFEGFILVLLAGFVIAMEKKKDTLACIFLAAAISAKIYPAVFVVLLISDRKYKSVIKTGVFVILFTLASLLFYEGGFTKNFNYAFGFFQGLSNHIATSNAIQRGISLFPAIKIFIINTMGEDSIDFNIILRIYMVAVFSVFFVTSYLMWRFSFKAWEKSFLLVTMMLLFPHLSCDYKLVLLYLPLWLLVNDGSTSNFDYIYLAAIGLLLVPKNYFMIQGIVSDSGYQDLSLGNFANIFIMLIASFSILVTALKRNRSPESSQEC